MDALITNGHHAVIFAGFFDLLTACAPPIGAFVV